MHSEKAVGVPSALQKNGWNNEPSMNLLVGASIIRSSSNYKSCIQLFFFNARTLFFVNMSPSRLSPFRPILAWTSRWANRLTNASTEHPLANWRQRASRRTRAVVEQYPMVALLTIVLLAVGLRAGLGDVVSYTLLGGFLVSLGYLGRLQLRRSNAIAPVQWSSLSLAIAVLFSFYHGKLQRHADFQIAAWKQSVEDLGSHLRPNVWQPIALRATIDSAVRYRRASVWKNRSKPGDSDADQLSNQSMIGWQSTTVLQVQEVRMGATWKPTSMVVPVTIDERVEDLLPGDRVEVYCQWKLPGEASNPGQWIPRVAMPNSDMRPKRRRKTLANFCGSSILLWGVSTASWLGPRSWRSALSNAMFRLGNRRWQQR